MLDEEAACGLCYTSGTTGHPKGVLYSHRSNVLHAMGACTPSCFGLSAAQTIMAVVPMFHANSVPPRNPDPNLRVRVGSG